MWWKEIKKITVASVITLLVYFLAELPLRLIMNTVESVMLSLIEMIIYILISFVFAYVYIWRNFLKDKKGENEIWKEQRDLTESKLDNSIMTIITKQKLVIICLFAISVVCWAVTGLESIILQKQLLSRILIIYAPIYMYVEVLPAFLGHIMGFLFGPSITSLFFLLLLKKYRKQWYNVFVLNKRDEKAENKK